ncbi:retron system putative HNH endonuclease [Laspinema olomoucense]|uniref:TIGR02646 family protein n=1 Tax=Laspinema olomoucense D3b TaxID=2953688 RepID=A0ABT2N491_9CYAN|nr:MULTISPECIES: retron system putative HNH endonuclease [unclassified Laspinema]MCT7972355.1 TIGR02646 family protein [Laspinema sp. D3d]MCT7977478.1 TIGR02646 family protein [Laspinema sp. D3b]MCT7986892.1 TIGR02646 family protein [Laspinema sp. D3a]
MKRIRKTHPPREFLEWLKENEGLDCSYAALQGKEAHTVLKNHLLKEQGFLCAYTGVSISEEDSHIEHIKPQSVCRTVPNPGKTYLEDVEYRNMVACFPKDGGDVSHGYGAPIKGGWWNEEQFVSPCQEDCERRFIYGWGGKVSPSQENDTAANTTIDILELNANPLQKRRYRAIVGFFGFSSKRKTKELSQREAKALLTIIDKPNSGGKLQEFCFVFEQLLPRYIQ